MLPDKNFFKKYCESKNIPWRERDVLREYLQTQILKALSLSEYNNTVSFLGGTSLRFIHKINRFSEDLDFDLIKKEGFDINQLDKILARNVKNLGLALDTKVKTTENIHIIFLKFKGVLQEFGFRLPKDEKFMIKFEIDFSPYKDIHFEAKFIDNFNDRFPVFINTLDTLFAQKVIALAFRPYQKGRDFYDLVWFLAQHQLEPNYEILKEKGLKINNRKEFVEKMKEIIARLDLRQAAKDVEPFLFHPQQASWIEDLPKHLESYKWND